MNSWTIRPSERISDPQIPLTRHVFEEAQLRAEALAADHAATFAHRNERIGLDVFNVFRAAVRPAYLQIRCSLRTQAEVQPEIIHGEKAGLAQHRLRLTLSAIMRDHGGPDCAAVRFRSH